jgi:protein arginine kinase activator
VLCEVCKEREGSLRLTSVTAEGVKREMMLCEKCAAERGVAQTPVVPPQIGELLSKVQQSMHGATAGAAAGPSGVAGSAGAGGLAGREAVRCDSCKATLGDFRATGRLGCAKCYDAFESSLRELLRRVHGNSRHAGHRYESPRPDALQRLSTVVELRDQLRRAIESEQFELAADIRDRLRVLE